jgi:hypothetical protein
MIHKGFQHRDISIGNVLFSKKPVDISSAVKDLEGLNAPEEMRQLVANLFANDECNGCVIDGDLAIELAKYSFNAEGKLYRSVRHIFVSCSILSQCFAQGHKRIYVNQVAQFHD